jgi:SP family myo-inositol transporter-like MFS transporter 13
MNVRGMGTAISTSCNWGGNLISEDGWKVNGGIGLIILPCPVGSTFLSLVSKITASGAFGPPLLFTGSFSSTRR